MKKYLLLAFTSILFSFTPPVESYKVDLTRSKIEWTGRKVTGYHTGEIKLASGQLKVDKQKLTGGVFELNMGSITTTDLTGESANKLLGHLKSDDFFSTAENPTSKFVITKVEHQQSGKAQVTGQLTIKGITNTLSFPASIKQKNGILVAIANGVKVDRTKYNIKYRSKNFISGLGDKAIDDDFELNINIVAKK
ncbi:MAG TPA: YceI family protein [Pelobium sp.]|nr:YceI family protein [Pelobium sp.]